VNSSDCDWEGGESGVKCEPTLNEEDDDDWATEDVVVGANNTEEEGTEADKVPVAGSTSSRRKAKPRKLINDSGGEEGMERAAKEELEYLKVTRKRKRTSLAAFCQRLSGEPNCQLCDASFPAMIDYVRHVKREHPNSHRQNN